MKINAMFDAPVIKTVNIAGNEYEIGTSHGFKCLPARAGSETSKTAKYNNITVTLASLVNGKYSVGITNDDGTMLISDEENGIKVVCREDGSLLTNVPVEKGNLVMAAYVMAFIYSTNELPHSATALVDSHTTGFAMEQTIGLLNDAAYYEFKHLMEREHITEIDVAFDKEAEVETYFDRAAGNYSVIENESYPPLAALPSKLVASTATASTSTPTWDNAKVWNEIKAGYFRKKYFAQTSLFNPKNVQELELTEKYNPIPQFFSVFKLLNAYFSELIGVVDEITGIDYTGSELSKNPNPFAYDLMKYVSTVMNFAFYGDPGSGKSLLPDILSAAFGLPVYHIGISEQTEVSDFLRSPTIGVKGGLSAVEMPFKQAFKDGGIIVLEEANLAKPGILQGVFSKALESPYELGEKEEEMTPRNPWSVIIMTANPGTAGTKRQNTAFYNRFGFWYSFESQEKKEMVQTILKKCPYLKGITNASTEIGTAYDIYSDVRILLKKEDGLEHIANVLSTRSIISYISCRYKAGMSRVEAGTVCFLEGPRNMVEELAVNDPEIGKAFMEKIYNRIRDKMKEAKYTPIK